ncbi:MAG: hypothetical protein LUQ36_00065 [Methanoregula sp.]|nr:hypothetical protein [Methanoregula sp.]
MDFVLITLCGFCPVQTKILEDESKLIGNPAFPASAARICGNTKHASSCNTIEQLMIILCTAVIRRAYRTDTHRPLFIGYLFAFFRIFSQDMFSHCSNASIQAPLS